MKTNIYTLDENGHFLTNKVNCDTYILTLVEN